MAHVYKATQWQSASGQFYCNDVSDLAGIAGLWWIPCKILGIPPVDYVSLLINEFKVSTIKFTGEVLIYSWSDKKDCTKYMNFINKKARERNFLV